MSELNYCVFKILTETKDPNTFSKVQKFELERRKDEKGLLLYDTCFTDIIGIYKMVLSNKLEDYEKSEKVLTFDEFIEFLEKFDYRLNYVGWNCLEFDIPQILFKCQQKNLDLNINKFFKLQRYTKSPVFDVMKWIYNWSYSNSLILTADQFGLKVDDILLKDFDDIGDKENYVIRQGRLIKELFKKVIKYY